jgi:hypothetical protein
MNLPSDPFFVVSYKLIPVGSGTTLPFINGKFSYLEGEKTISIDIKQTRTELVDLKPEKVSELIAAATLPEKVKPETQPEITPQVSEEEIESNPVITQPQPEEEKKPPEVSAPELKSNRGYLLEPEEGIYYRVQLAAGHKSVNIPRYFKKYQLDKEVRKEYHEGWHKYSVGSFPVYKQARDYRVHIWNTTPIDDAFVSAYNNGKRITVQEALMIANQQWYK